MNDNLKVAVQKKGRLYDGSMVLLKECGIDVNNGNNQLRVQASNFPLEVFFLRVNQKLSITRVKTRAG